MLFLPKSPAALVFLLQDAYTGVMDYEILPPTDDWIFKLLFGDERRKN
ncbi:hypothetical protein FACS1894137_00040 [Spirochaetia bacterium]|nr:hypothetical protein FACS1894137_00040 [Spirochaetia bacterium]